MIHRPVLVLATFAVAVALWAAPAEGAPSDDAKAAAHLAFAKGVAELHIGNLEAARDLFVASAASFPYAHVLLELGRVLDVLGQHQEALAVYRQYLLYGPLAFEAEDVQGRVDDIVAELSAVKVPVTVTLEPVDASVAVPGEVVVPSVEKVASLFLVPGTYTLEITSAGFTSSLVPIEVVTGAPLEVPVTLVKKVLPTWVTIDTIPTGKTIVVDASPFGVAPWQGPLKPGEYQLVVAPGTSEEVHQVLVVPEEGSYTLTVDLTPPPLVPDKKPRPPSKYLALPIIGWSTFLLGAGALIGGGIFGGNAVAHLGQAEALNPLADDYSQSFDAEVDAIEGNLFYANRLIVTGSILGGIGLVLLSIDTYTRGVEY